MLCSDKKIGGSIINKNKKFGGEEETISINIENTNELYH